MGQGTLLHASNSESPNMENSSQWLGQGRIAPFYPSLKHTPWAFPSENLGFLKTEQQSRLVTTVWPLTNGPSLWPLLQLPWQYLGILWS